MMDQTKIDTKKLFRNLAVFLCFALLGAGTINAQEASAASLYNDGLALLKEKDFVGGYEAMLVALEKATAEENEQVIAVAKKNGAVAAYTIGNSLLKEKDLDGAMKYYTSGIELNPEYSSNYIGQGKIYDEKGDVMSAIDSFLKGAAIAGDNGRDKKTDEAFKRSKQIVGKLFVDKQYEDAVTAGTKINEVNPMSDILYYVSRSHIELGKFQEGLETADKAIEVGTADGSLEDKYYVAKGLALEGLNKTNEAVEAYKMVKDGDYKEQAVYKIQQLGGK